MTCPWCPPQPPRALSLPWAPFLRPAWLKPSICFAPAVSNPPPPQENSNTMHKQWGVLSFLISGRHITSYRTQIVLLYFKGHGALYYEVLHSRTWYSVLRSTPKYAIQQRISVQSSSRCSGLFHDLLYSISNIEIRRGAGLSHDSAIKQQQRTG